MNSKGLEYCKEIERRFNQIKFDAHRNPRPTWSWADSNVQERLMRLGVEARLYGLDLSDTESAERLTVATLTEV